MFDGGNTADVPIEILRIALATCSVQNTSHISEAVMAERYLNAGTSQMPLFGGADAFLLDKCPSGGFVISDKGEAERGIVTHEERQ